MKALLRRPRAPFLAFALLFGSGSSLAADLQAPAPSIPNCTSYVLMDFRTGAILAEKRPNLQLPPASLTKLMTAYLTYKALAEGRLHWQQQIPVSNVAWHTGGSSMFIQPNLPVTVDQLMHGLIIDSGNDAAVALAQAVAGTRASFVAEMNAEAQKMGLTGAHYSNVDGLPDPGLHLSALNIATLSRNLIQRYPQVIDISKIKFYRYNHITQRSWNPALFGHPSIDGLKTGHTNAAGHCMDTTALRDGRRLIAVVMGAPNWPAGVDDVVALLNYGYAFTRDVEAVPQGALIGVYRDPRLDPQKFTVKAAHSVWVTVPTGEQGQLQRSVSYRQLGDHGVAAGAVVGTLRITLHGKVLGETPLLASQASKPAGTLGTWWHEAKDAL
ncbi:D-alanyl-D-alanine carboxypeptidase family protein [Candidatus Igneacidithiobacillus taiwanensis]|uniref:D-alanyl-D-alanine carboxypeptidase family protein n=1 Tax=Candidatus Igneacidithiobacillus taiwanensis TaxID=1945924 RepID=UPI00289934A4|nr:D-alanyl-D-alanine carboxypeptidase family protein [Candidatus Igneacidithiobacillus taiwanensis]